MEPALRQQARPVCATTAYPRNRLLCGALLRYLLRYITSIFTLVCVEVLFASFAQEETQLGCSCRSHDPGLTH